jgi:NADP-dependent 3-hydroxy acid dehydrogenase YdfG
MKRDLFNQVVVIVGASSGIGRAAALAFAREGAQLVLAARDAAALDDVLGECTDLGARALAVSADMTDEYEVAALRKGALQRFGQIDVWVNDAAVYMLGRFEETPPDAFKAVLDTNVMGVVLGAREAIAQFRIQGRGTLINVGSLAGKVPYALASAYCASKHAIVALTSILRQELEGSGIDVCLVTPATVDTPLFQHAANFSRHEIVAMPPVYRPERVAAAIVACAKRPRREKVVGVMPRLARLARLLAPGLYERGRARSIEEHHLGSAARDDDMGNVPSPRPPHATSGGWRFRRARAKGLRLLAAAAR